MPAGACHVLGNRALHAMEISQLNASSVNPTTASTKRNNAWPAQLIAKTAMEIPHLNVLHAKMAIHLPTVLPLLAAARRVSWISVKFATAIRKSAKNAKILIPTTPLKTSV